MKHSYFFSLATLGPLGHLPMPGTFGSLAAVPLIVVLHRAGSPFLYAMATLAALSISYAIIARAASAEELEQDPSAIILDEVVGCMVTFLWVPCTLSTLLIGFALFRLFDIFKPFGISRFERMGGALGIMADDVVAGLLSNLALQLVCWKLCS